MTLKEFFRKYIFSLLLIIGLLAVSNALAAETLAVGQVMNITDRSPIKGVNVYFKNTSIGVQSNEEGYFKISTSGKETTLVFSSIGYKTRELKLKYGTSVGLEVLMEEENTLLQEVFITPGSNPALEWIKMIRLTKKRNDVSRQVGFTAQSKEQNLVLLSKFNQRLLNKKIYEQLQKGALNQGDTSLVVPVYMSENTFQITHKDKKLIQKNTFSTPQIAENIIAQLVGEIETELNFYDNTITVFGKSIISPLSNLGNSFYRYYLTDSVMLDGRKQYDIRFVSRNEKNLAFNGQLRFDSTTLAITSIVAELPAKANINFMHNLRITQQFEQLPGRYWARSTEELTLNMTYEILADSLHSKPQIFVKRTAKYNYTDSIKVDVDNFAKSEYNQQSLNDRLDELNNTPIMRTAKWLADIAFTGYMRLGKIDLGKVQQLARVTDIEGLRVNIPLRTNEQLWKNVSVGGYVGYGFGNKELKYSGAVHFKLKGVKRRILGFSYTNDYRIINYDYNNFSYKENPLYTGDEDIANTLLANRSADRMNGRKELLVTFSNDWNSNLETTTFFRSHQLFSNASLPMINASGSISSFQQKSATIENRFSFGERTYEDHLQRIYVGNSNPILYATMEMGKFQVEDEKGSYAKLMTVIKQNVRMDFGQLRYLAEVGWIFGKVPYPLLQIPYGNNRGGYSFYGFNLMR